jgi:hypothetical protein
MVSNRVVRYFYYLGYALAQSELTQFSVFKISLNYFYSSYMLKQCYIKEPGRYPLVYGLN